MSETLFIDQIKQAASERQRLQITGNQSKISRCTDCQPLNATQHNGIVEYNPAELFVTVKTGTKLAELEAELAENNQKLAFDPPDYGSSTVGGTYAFGLSGSSQPFYGSFRDFVLGIKMIDGRGQLLNFGGQMIKNVAGYDVSRLLSGSKGYLGLITEITIKLTPLLKQKTYSIEVGQADAIKQMNKLARSTLPISAAAYYQGKLYYRLDGVHSVQSAMPEDNAFWDKINPYRPNLSGEQKLWRISVDAMAPTIPNTVLVDQSGARRWVISENKPEAEHVNLWEVQGDKIRCPEEEIHPKIVQIKKGLKEVFDPNSIFH